MSHGQDRRPRILAPAIALLIALTCSARADTALWRVLFVGDSLTANLGVRSEEQYPALIERQFGNILAQNAGLPGATMMNTQHVPGWVHSRYITASLSVGKSRLTAVVILLGTNDWSNGRVNDFEAAYREFLADVPEGVDVVCVTPPWASFDGKADQDGETLDDFRAAVRRACAGRIVVDGSAAIPHEARYFQDGLHPNALGNGFLARAVGVALRSLIP